MTFSPEWDREFREGRHLSRWPWSDLVSFVKRYTDSKTVRILELGCGAGANVGLFVYTPVRYYFGVDGSKRAISLCNSYHGVMHYPHVEFKCTDFTKEIPFEGQFDLIFDRAAVTHNDTKSIKRCIELVKDKLKPGGKYVGIDWFSTDHDGYHRKRDTVVVDGFTYTDFKDGLFKGVGKVHFSSREHLYELFEGFTFEALEHKITLREIPEYYKMASWNFVCSLKK